MNKVLWVFLIILIASCDNEESSTARNMDKETGEIISVEKPFQQDSFKAAVEEDILKELNICSSGIDSLFTPCSAKYFTLKSFRKDKELKDAFLLQVRGGVRLTGEPEPFPVRRLLVFERENDALIRVNGFVGDLDSFERSGTDIEHIIVAFYDAQDDVMFHCLFEWEERKFSFKEVVSIDIGSGPKPVKKEQLTEVSNEVYQLLMDKSMIF
jgi:hypothetical protein